MKDDPAWFGYISRTYMLREKGFLPHPGSYLQQPAALVQAWDVMDTTLAEVERVLEKKRKLQSGGGR